MIAESSNVRVYTVNGATAGSSSSLPDWLTRKRASASKGGGRKRREHVESTLELIQGFEFPEASNRVKTTQDGTHVVATGTYKPQMRVWDLNQLSLKFERHTDAENVDFVLLSDDWTKSIHLQNDRTVELHTQGGFHYRTRIPKFGRSLAYHYPSCDAILAASGNEVYRLNLDQGRFMTPLLLEDETEDILGVNVVDINPAHQLFAFGLDGNGSVQFWDPRSRNCVGVLRLPVPNQFATSSFDGLAGNQEGLSVTALCSRVDGLSYAVGTSTGHTLLYDIRSTKSFASKDQGYGLPVKNVSWIEGGSRMAGDGMVMSTDKKVIKIWDRNSPSTNFCSITPATDLNYVHHIPGSGILLAAVEGIQMATYYIPQLGPAPRWASFLENITEEMEDQTTRTVYEDYKFVERKELSKLGLDHLIGTPALKPYMHGYFISLKLYDTARVIANPFEYAEHRERMIREKMDKMAETRIRSKKSSNVGVKVNKALAEKILKEEEKERKREERKKRKKAQEKAVTEEEGEEEDDMNVDDEENDDDGDNTSGPKNSLLSDPRFAKVFEDPAFEVDVNSREYALLNPSTVAQGRHVQSRGKTAVEDEEEESDKHSSDGLGESDSESESGSGDSSDEGELTKFDPRSRPGQKNLRAEEAYARTKQQNRKTNNNNVKLVPMRAQTSAMNGAGNNNNNNKDATFGQRMSSSSSSSKPFVHKKSKSSSRADDSAMRIAEDGGLEMSWVPATSSGGGDKMEERKSRPRKQKGVESFGAGMERGQVEMDAELSESERKGRTQRRTGVRSGSKNVFRRM